MWVSLVMGFDPDGQLVTKWREAFQRHGELVGELSLQEEYVEALRRHTPVARLRLDGKDVVPPLADAVVRVMTGRIINASGISDVTLFNNWRPAAWRMEIMSLDKPLSEA